MGRVADGSVLHSSAIRPDVRAFVIQVFVPLMTKPSATGVATVRIAWRSEPPSGSVSAIVARSSPVASRGRYRCCCSSVPKRTISFDTTEWPPNTPARDIHPRAISSVTRA